MEFLADDSIVDVAKGTCRVFGKARKMEKPVLSSEMPWTDSQNDRGRSGRPRETCRKRACGSRETSIAPASVPSVVAKTTFAGADATGSAKKKSMEVRARAEVDPAVGSRDEHGRGTVQFTEDSSRPGGARPTFMR